ncbi:MAG: Mov34/MPN/PAD-1 family protein [Methanobrevibacter sp.]
MGLISKILKSDDNDSNTFNKVCVDREVLESVIYYAKKAYPHEFLSMLDGLIKDNALYITGLIFIPGETSDTGAVLHYDQLPPNTKFYGTVHSHPGPSAMPSDADLETFSKRGFFHMIVRLPYTIETFKAYDKGGNPMDFEIGDYSYLKEEEFSDFFDEDDILTDDDNFSDEEEEFLESFDDIHKRTDYDEFSKNYKNTFYIPSPGQSDSSENPITINPEDLDDNNVIEINASDIKRGININLEPGMPVPRIVIKNDQDIDYKCNSEDDFKEE